MYRTSFSFVTEAKPTGRAITWFGYDAPHGTAYLPFFGAATEGAPQAWHSHEGYQSKFSTKVAWWPFNLVNQYSDLNFRVINPEVQAKAHKIEAKGMELVAQWEKQAANLSEDDAVAFLTQRSNDFAAATLQEWWDFTGHLWAKFGRYVVTYNETEQGTDAFGQAYPEWWLRNPYVGFTTWTRDGPHVGVSNGWEAWIPGWKNVVFDVVVLLLLVARVAHRAGVRKGEREAREELGYCAEP
jgi:hypothetical protein